jgi:putative mycofactocin binding protein MftB
LNAQADRAQLPGPDRVLELGWRVHPQVALREEPFGALAYHFGTRRLSFLKSPALLAVVQTLAEHPTAAEACRTAGIADDELPRYAEALAALAGSGMICQAGAA